MLEEFYEICLNDYRQWLAKEQKTSDEVLLDGHECLDAAEHFLSVGDEASAARCSRRGRAAFDAAAKCVAGAGGGS